MGKYIFEIILYDVEIYVWECVICWDVDGDVCFEQGIEVNGFSGMQQ